MMFGGIGSEYAYHFYSYSTTLCSIITNSLLIINLIFNKLNHVGAYRWLLFCFATGDILISLNHTAMFPGSHMTEFGYIFWGYRLLDQPTHIGFYGSLVWCFLFYQSFILLAFHYVYRYVVLCNPPWLSFMFDHPWRNWVTLAILADLFYTGTIVAVVGLGWEPNEESRRAFAPVLMVEYGIDLYSENRPGYIAMTYWIRQEDGTKRRTWLPVVTMTIGISIVFTGVIIIFFCIIRILGEMRTVKWNKLQSGTKHMQRRLVRALLWQTIVPMIFCYIPIAIIIFFPLFFEISLGGTAMIGFMSMELFPIIDPLLILYFVTGFRVPIPRLISDALYGPTSSSHSGVSEITTKVQNSVNDRQRMPT